jgi:hypothetical protein
VDAARLTRAARSPGAVLFVTQFVLLDVALDGGWLRRPGAVRAAVASVLLWTALLAVARVGRPARVAVASFAAALLVLQLFVHRFVHVPLDVQVAEAARHSLGAIRPVIVKMLPAAALAALVVAALELAILTLAQRRFGLRAGALLAAGACAAIASGPELRLATPEVRALDALGVLRRAPPAPVAGAVALPALQSARREVPDVLFVLTESVRAADYVSRGPEATAPEVAEATPGRFELDELRSISSYTAVSLSALITGRTQEGSREEILKAPNLFDFAHAAGADVGYYSAQSRETFETKDVRAAVDRFVTLETLAGHDVDDDAEWVERPLDRMIIERFVAELPSRAHPSVTLLQLYGTHAPYYFEEEAARFQPYERAVGWSGMPKLRNAYRNAILAQDREVARALRAFVAHAAGRPWLVVFTSDHGEAFGEHAAIHHGQNLYDEQVRVPGFIAAGAGTLTAVEARALADQRTRFVTHLDLLPTVLDALGLLSNFSVQSYASRMPGQSLLRAPGPRAPIPVTNCTGMFPCPLNTWGLFAEDRKLVAQVWDAEWRCLDIRGGERLAAQGDAACAALGEASRWHFARLPNGAPNR